MTTKPKKEDLPTKEEFREAAMALGVSPSAEFADEMYDLLNADFSEEDFEKELHEIVVRVAGAE